MSNYRVLTRRVVSQDGKTVAEAKSVVITSSENEDTIAQSVIAEVSSDNSFSSSSTHGYGSGHSSSSASSSTSTSL